MEAPSGHPKDQWCRYLLEYYLFINVKTRGAWAGLVCTGGEYITGWDPRVDESSPNQGFHVNYCDATGDDLVYTMISACESQEGGLPQLLTGGWTGN